MIDNHDESAAEPRKVSINEAVSTVQTRLAGADIERGQQLGGLQTVRTAKSTSLGREQARLSKNLGADHPRVLALTQKIAVHQNISAQLLRAVARTANGVEADPNAWIVHGHVYSKDLQPVPQVTVALYTREGEWQRQYGFACTDAGGYYKLSIKRDPATPAPATDPKGTPAPGAAAPASDQVPLTLLRDKAALNINQPGAAPAAGGETLSINTNASNASVNVPQLFLRVTDGKQALLGGDPRPLAVTFGGVDYREIILRGGVCTPPSGDTRTGPLPDGSTGQQGRFLGNSSTHELHDLQNVKKNCQIAEIVAARRVPFNTVEAALKAGYDYCAFCFSPSKR